MKLKELKKSYLLSKQLAKLNVDELHNNESPSCPVIVSLTSIPSRFDVIHLTVRSVLSGTVKPEKVLLWLHESHRGKLPPSLEQLQGSKFEIRYSKLDSPHLKLVETLRLYPSSVIVTCDDDLLYEPEWLQRLYKDHKKFPGDILAHECRCVSYDENGSPQPYSYWYREHLGQATYDGLMPLGFGGVLYPPNCFHDDVLNQDLYLSLTPKADDLWFKMMSHLKGTQSRLTSNPVKTPAKTLNSQTVNLRDLNINQDGNRTQWVALANHYNLKAFLPFAINKNRLPDASKQSTDAIDAVITWVNGEDPVHANKMKAYLAEQGIERPKSAHPTRYNDCGELGYCVASILKFAPWVRHIYIVTDAQQPPIFHWIKNTPFADKIKLIDHQQVFQGHENHLPTFNTRSISAALWRIPGLAEQFIYLNDDFFIVKSVQPTDFFIENKTVLRGKWHKQGIISKLRKGYKAKKIKANNGSLPPRPGFLDAQNLSAKKAGFKNKCFRLEHNPHPMRKSTLEAFANSDLAEFDQQISHRFRSPNQTIVESLAAHLELAANNAVIDNTYNVVQITPEKLSRKRIKWRLKKAKANPKTAFACIQNIDKATPRSREQIFTWLRDQICTI
ncbi:Stealth CR1 domain-containing protein [Reinekea forsetii]|nr:Stealth CR1 domain-containing protein [Reinekea forsetii]